MADFANGKIQAFVGPTELGAHDDLERVIVDFIHGARLTLDIAVQELRSEPIAQAVLDARWRGVRVRMFLEQDYLKRKKLPPARPRGNETEEQALNRAQWTEYRRPRDAKTRPRHPHRLPPQRHRRQGRLQPPHLPSEVHHP